MKNYGLIQNTHPHRRRHHHHYRRNYRLRRRHLRHKRRQLVRTVVSTAVTSIDIVITIGVGRVRPGLDGRGDCDGGNCRISTIASHWRQSDT